MDYIKYNILVECMTYNHSRFITDAMNGFCLQQTDFPYVCTIMDDASNDGEPDVIKAFFYNNFDVDDANIYRKEETTDYIFLFARHKTNRNCFFAVFFLKVNHCRLKKDKSQYLVRWKEHVDYIAMCEGDDFWTDSEKLQKEYVYLNNHPEKGLVYTNCNVLFHDEGIIHKDVFSSGYFKSTNSYKDFLLEGKYLTPCSWVYRTNELSDIKVPPFVTDWTLFIAFSLLVKGRVGYINDTTCTYRVSHESASHNSDMNKRYNYLKGAFAAESFFLDYYPSLFTEEDKDLLYERRYKNLMRFAVAFNDKPLLYKIKSFRFKTLNWKSRLILLLSGFSLIRKYVYKRLKESIKKGL